MSDSDWSLHRIMLTSVAWAFPLFVMKTLIESISPIAASFTGATTLSRTRSGALSLISRICSLVSQSGERLSGMPSELLSIVQESVQTSVSSKSPPWSDDPCIDSTLIPRFLSVSEASGATVTITTSCSVVYGCIIGRVTVLAAVT